MRSRTTPSTALMMPPRRVNQPPIDLNGRNTKSTATPMPRPIAWNIRVKNVTMGSSLQATRGSCKVGTLCLPF